MKKHLTGIAFALLFCGVLSFNGPVTANAQSTIYSQTVDTSQTTATNVTAISQGLGTGLSGVLSEISLKYNHTDALGTTATFTVTMIECSANDYTQPTGTCTGIVRTLWSLFDIEGSDTIGDHQIFLSTSTGYAINPSKYYWIELFNSNTGGVHFKWYGASTNVYPGGSITTSGFNSATPLVDLFFVLNGVQTSSDRSYTTLNWPAQASTTASTQVNFNFGYHAAGANQIDSYALVLSDITQPGSVTITGSASTGDATVSRTLTLTSGHTYTWTAYICGTNETCYGGTTNTFSVVSPNYSIGVTGSSATNTVPFPVGPGGVLIPLPLITDSNASSSADQTVQSFLNFPAMLSNVFPFTWMYQIGSMFKEASSASTTVPTYTVDFSNASTSLEYPMLDEIGQITLFSTEKAEQFVSYDQWQYYRNIFANLMWVAFALVCLYRFLSLYL